MKLMMAGMALFTLIFRAYESMNIKLQQIDNNRWLIPKHGNMHVPGMIFADNTLINQIENDSCIKQVINVATLSGIIGKSIAMPDIHSGYGFPIGGVAGFDAHDGIISPGGVGYDINCGCRLMTTAIQTQDIYDRLGYIADALFSKIPTGVGITGYIKLNKKDLVKVSTEGANWSIMQGYGDKDNLQHIENNGVMHEADPSVISDKAFNRGMNQLGTLGAGNHFVELQEVTEIFDTDKANILGINVGQLTVMIHTGSRGFGHQICDDFLHGMQKIAIKNIESLPDRQLVNVPVRSDMGRKYFAAMACAANYAWANRQIISHFIAEVLMKNLSVSPKELNWKLLYDVCHNIAKMENHNGNQLVVHRKGATRALPPFHTDLPANYKSVGQPVIIPGDMGTNSYLLAGSEKSEETFHSSCHGAGRTMSRSLAIKLGKGRAILDELKHKGITVRCANFKTLLEEMPDAYKNVSNVVDVIDNAGIAVKVAKLKPLVVIKG